MVQPAQLKRTPFPGPQVAGRSYVPFAGWEMPVHYTSILDEARAVRIRAGLFDVSHMGRLDVRGPGAESLLDRVFSSDVPALRVGRARYGVICTQGGGIINDCILYRREPQRFLLVPNAANCTTVLEWLSRWTPDKNDVQIADVTPRLSMIALQGPQAADMLSDLTELGVSTMRVFPAVEANLACPRGEWARRSQTPDRLRHTPADHVFSAHRRRGPDDRAD